MRPALVVTNNHSGLAIARGLGMEGVPVVALNHGADILGGSIVGRSLHDCRAAVCKKDSRQPSVREATADRLRAFDSYSQQRRNAIVHHSGNVAWPGWLASGQWRWRSLPSSCWDCPKAGLALRGRR